MFAGTTWLHSRRSGNKLNIVSYGVVGILVASLFFALLTWAAPSLADGLSELYIRSDYYDWVTSSKLPEELSSPSSPFRGRVESLVRQLENGDGSTEAPLVYAQDLEKSSFCTKPEYMFEDVQVRPTCVAYSPSPSQTPSDSANELKVFQSFSDHIVDAFGKAETAISDTATTSKHTERTLAQALMGSGEGPRLEIPWIYVANKDGSIAVFPGNTFINTVQSSKNPAWATNARPWYQAEFTDNTRLAYDLGGESLLSSVYSDILRQRPTLVRTYLHKFYYPGVKDPFVIGIDLHWPDDANLFPNSRSGRYLAGVATLSLSNRIWSSIVFSALLLLSVAWMTSEGRTIYAFDLLDSKYGEVDSKIVTSFQSQRKVSRSSVLSLKNEKIFGLGYSRTKDRTSTTDTTISDEQVSGVFRGIEVWKVSRIWVSSWQFLWLRFESIARSEIGLGRLLYLEEIAPKGTWIDLGKNAFPEAERGEGGERLMAALVHNAFSSKLGHFEILEHDFFGSASTDGSNLPESVRSLVGSEKLVSIRYGRAYVALSDTNLDTLYAASDVKAVIIPSYFERLLEFGQTEFLLQGRTIERIICFPDEKANLNLSSKGRAVFGRLLDSYAPSSRNLRRVNGPVLRAASGTPQPIYDFAILNDSLLVVSDTVMEASKIDVGTSAKGRPTYSVDGYLSWRKADVEFYLRVWSDLLERSSAMGDHSLEVNGKDLAEVEPAKDHSASTAEDGSR
jgi:hypothetical protein